MTFIFMSTWLDHVPNETNVVHRIRTNYSLRQNDVDEEEEEKKEQN